MSRLAGFYIAKAIESAAGGTTEAAASRTPPRRAGDHAALDATSSHDRSAAILQLVTAAVHRTIGGLGKASQAHRRLDHPRVPRESLHGNHQHVKGGRQDTPGAA
jgi:hypothetical protein